MAINFDLERQVKTHYIIHKFSVKASKSVAEKVWKKKLILINPKLVFDNIKVIKPVLVEMLVELGELYGVNVTTTRANVKVASFLTEQAFSFIKGSLVAVRGLSEVTNATLAGVLTEKLGWRFIEEIIKNNIGEKEIVVLKDGKDEFIMTAFGIDIPYDKRIKCHLVIHGATATIMGTSFVTVPVIGRYSVQTIQAGMIVGLAKVFNIPMNIELANEYLLKSFKDKSWETIKSIVAGNLPIVKIGKATIDAISTERLGWKVAQDFYNKTKNNML